MKIFGDALLPKGFQESNDIINGNNLNYADLAELERVKKALRTESKAPKCYSENLSRQDLAEMTSFVNNANFHYSGNCVLLSACLHYNINHRKNIYSATNSSPPTLGIDSFIVETMFFGKELEASTCLLSLEEVADEMFNVYDINRVTSFIICAENYMVPFFGTCWHNFNGVILTGKDNKPAIQFLDAWKTSNRLPTPRQLSDQFSSSSQFYIRYSP